MYLCSHLFYCDRILYTTSMAHLKVLRSAFLDEIPVWEALNGSSFMIVIFSIIYGINTPQSSQNPTSYYTNDRRAALLPLYRGSVHLGMGAYFLLCWLFLLRLFLRDLYAFVSFPLLRKMVRKRCI